MSKYLLKPDYDWNPLTKHRNIPCPCGSGKKAKRCHGRHEALPIDLVNRINGYIIALAEAGFIDAKHAERPNG